MDVSGLVSLFFSGVVRILSSALSFCTAGGSGVFSWSE